MYFFAFYIGAAYGRAHLVNEIIVAVDIGTSKVCTLIGQVNKANQIEVLGRGINAYSGVRKGIIVDIENTANAIKNSVQEAETMANLKVGSAYLNIMGVHVSIVNNRVAVNIENENREITHKDMEKAFHIVKDIPVQNDRQIIDIITRQYIIDGYDEIVDPVGMVGVKLEVDADIITGKITSVQNIVKSMERANLKVDGLIVEALATSEIALISDEKDIGVVLIDIGGGMTDISIFKNKNLIFYNSIPVGGDHITNDISIGLKIPYAEAEKIKKEYELALTSLIKNDQEVTVTDLNDNKKKHIKVSEVVEIIEARVQEIFYLCQELIEQSNISEKLSAGVVLTGGGISYVDGAKQIAGEVFKMNVRIASFRSLGLTKPEYSVAAGIIKYVSRRHKGNDAGSEVKLQKQKRSGKDNGFLSKIAKVFSDYF
ncbi:MAG: cell division protein FtsA [bacterium]|nr:cell division protein FtsA [bacterium]